MRRSSKRPCQPDDDLFIEAAKAWLPPYRGPGLILFRGANIDRFERGSIGSAWSDKEETAATFARGLNAEGKGGVILRTHAPAEAIIAGPTDHSANWLRENEFTVDPPARTGSLAPWRRHPFAKD